MGNRVQHALRAFTPRDQKAVKAAAETMRANSKLDVAVAITELSVGEALVSFLDEKGRPCVVERAFVVPPVSQIGPISDAERSALLANSIVAGVYEKTVDRESAYEKLKARAENRQGDVATTVGTSGSRTDGAAQPAPTNASGDAEPGFFDKIGGMFGSGGGGAASGGTGAGTGGRVSSRRESIGEAMAKSAARAIGSQVGREILRGVLGSIMGSKRR